MREMPQRKKPTMTGGRGCTRAACTPGSLSPLISAALLVAICPERGVLSPSVYVLGVDSVQCLVTSFLRLHGVML